MSVKDTDLTGAFKADWRTGGMTMVSKEETFEQRIKRAREPMPDICDETIARLADENDRLRADNAKLLATLEHSATHKALDALANENATLRALANENATLRAQLAECMAQVERMRTRLEFLAKLRGAL